MNIGKKRKRKKTLLNTINHLRIIDVQSLLRHLRVIYEQSLLRHLRVIINSHYQGISALLMHSHHWRILRKDPYYAAYIVRSALLGKFNRTLSGVSTQSLLQHFLNRPDHTIIYLLTMCDNSLVTLIHKIHHITAQHCKDHIIIKLIHL